MRLPLYVFTFALMNSVFAGEKDILFSTHCSKDNSEATISFVGDVLIHKALYQVVVSETKHFSQIWRKTDSLIQKADFSLANLEGPSAMGIDSNGRDQGDIGFVYDGRVYSGTNFLFNYHPRILSDLKASGYDMIQTANNHSMDRFSIGVDKTIEAARNADLATTGSRKSDEPMANTYSVARINNINVAFLACTESTNGIPDNDGQIVSCFKEKVLATIRDLKARPGIDAVIVLPHWGVEYRHTPEDYQKSWARKYLEAGAVAVIGSHPHVLQPWEKYTTSDNRETLILYSLGNFVAGQAGVARKTGPVAYLGLSKTTGAKAKIFGVGYTPTFREGATLNPVGSNGSREVLNHVASMYGSRSRIEPDAALKPSLCAK